MAEADADWEVCKENAQPLRQGRKASSLATMDAPVDHDALAAQTARWEEALKSASDDPLQVWCDYVKWTQQTHSKGGKSSQLMPLLERCVHSFKDQPRYANDTRYLRLWIAYADCVRDPEQIFDYLYGRRIGEGHALFWLSWAAVLETKRKYDAADKVYTQGKQMRASPLERLEKVQYSQHCHFPHMPHVPFRPPISPTGFKPHVFPLHITPTCLCCVYSAGARTVPAPADEADYEPGQGGRGRGHGRGSHGCRPCRPAPRAQGPQPADKEGGKSLSLSHTPLFPPPRFPTCDSAIFPLCAKLTHSLTMPSTRIPPFNSTTSRPPSPSVRRHSERQSSWEARARLSSPPGRWVATFRSLWMPSVPKGGATAAAPPPPTRWRRPPVLRLAP